MPDNKIIKKLTEKQTQKYEELEADYKKLYKELGVLEIEGKELKKEIKSIIDKAKIKNILQDILNQPD